MLTKDEDRLFKTIFIISQKDFTEVFVKYEKWQLWGVASNATSTYGRSDALRAFPVQTFCIPNSHFWVQEDRVMLQEYIRTLNIYQKSQSLQ